MIESELQDALNENGILLTDALELGANMLLKKRKDDVEALQENHEILESRIDDIEDKISMILESMNNMKNELGL